MCVGQGLEHLWIPGVDGNRWKGLGFVTAIGSWRGVIVFQDNFWPSLDEPALSRDADKVKLEWGTGTAVVGHKALHSTPKDPVSLIAVHGVHDG